jgi:polyhydroxyalkanoate synthesis regulator phasin
MANKNINIPSDSFPTLVNINKQTTFILVLSIAFYTSFLVHSLSDNFLELFQNSFFKFIIFVVVSVIASDNPTLGIILAIGILVTLQLSSINEVKKELCDYENFSPADKNEIFMSDPLLLQNKLNPSINNINLKLENPNEKYKNMIKKGKILLDDSYELKNDIMTRHDTREDEISNITQRDGMVLIQSGNNRLQKSDDGSYNLSDNDVSNINYIKFNNIESTYQDNDNIIELIKDIKNKYIILINNYEINPADFDNKLKDIYDLEYELLLAIYDIKNKSFTLEKQQTISNLITEIKVLKSNNHNYYDYINKLLQILA